MRCIDEKGRLFGVINVIDFLVIVFLLSVIPAIYFGYRIITMQKPGPFRSKFIEVYLNCKLVKLGPDIANKVSINDRELDSKGTVIGQVIELGKIEPYEKNPLLKQRQALLRLKLEFREADLFYKDDLVDCDSELIFKTNKYTAAARVNDELTKMLSVNITLRDLDEHTAVLIKAGDKEIGAAGKIIAEIVRVGKPVESFREIELDRGRFTVGKIINKKQITAEMILRCQEISNDFYFKGVPLTYDSPVKFVTDRYKVKGFLSKRYEVMGEKNSNSPKEDMAE